MDLRHTTGYLVADAQGRIVGRVECPMYGTSPETPDALSVRSGFLRLRGRQGQPSVSRGCSVEFLGSIVKLRGLGGLRASQRAPLDRVRAPVVCPLAQLALASLV